MKPYLNLGIILVGIVLCQLFFVSSQILAEEDPELTEIQQLIHQVDSLIDTRQLDTAIVLGQLALEKAQKKFGESDTIVALVLHVLGLCYYYQADYAKSESLSVKALAIREKILGPDHLDVAQSINNLALVYGDQNKFAEAESLHKRALAIREKALGPNHLDVVRSLSNLAILYVDQRKLAEAEPHQRRALDIQEQVLGPDHPDVASALGNLATLYYWQGKYLEAEPLYKRALAIREKALGPDHPLVAQGLSNLAILYGTQGRYTKAEPFCRQAKDIREKALGPDHPNLAKTMNVLAILCQHQSRYKEAESLYKRALDIKEGSLGPDHPEVATSLNNLANLYREQSKYTEAEPLYQRALSIRKKAFGPDHSEVAVTLNHLAVLYQEQGRYTEAEPLCQQALDIREKTLGPGHPDAAVSLYTLASLHRDQGRYMKAESLCQQALAIWEKAFSSEHPHVAKSLGDLAMLYVSLGETDRSSTYYRKLQQSRQDFIEYVFSYASEEQKMRYIEKYPLVNHSLLSFAIMTNSDESRSSALEMILKSKAVVIDAVSAEKQIAFCSYNDEIQKKAQRHAEVCGEISTLVLAGAEALEPEIYRDRLQALYSIKDSLETELSKSCAEFKDELAARRFTVTEVANTLPKGSVLWEFVRYEPYDFNKVGSDRERTGPPRYLAFTIDHTGKMTLTDLGDAGEIDSLVSLARKQIYKAKAEVYSPLVVESEKRLSEVTGRLYEIIFAPLESYLGDRTDVFISPDGELNLLPFEILACPDGKYAIEKFRISYLSSGRDLLRFKRKQKPGDWALVMADPDFDLSQEALAEHRDKTLKESEIFSLVHEPSRGVSGCLNNRFNPLPYSREETKSIGRTLKKKGKLNVGDYYGGDALEEVLKGMTTSPRILHLATHGYFCEDIALTENKMLENPLLRSGLALAGANRLMNENPKGGMPAEDGILTAFEVSGLNLIGTDLITLSACETGVGEVKNCEGVYGLRRAFQHAGARTVVMSLWKVPDKETCDLMEDFYKNWLAGQTKKGALRQSVLNVLSACRAKYGAAHPLFWGGFVMAGDPN